MFELLLQADRALSNGNLDQAERTYWQLTELDPTNAIAISGLAAVAMERGDVRLARTFATRALAFDPEDVMAKRIVETLEGGRGEVAPEPARLPEDLPLLAAQRLEELSRHRLSLNENVDETPAAERRRAGRQGAAAGEEAAPRPDTANRRRPWARTDFHLSSVNGRGRRRFEPAEMKALPLAEDPFAAAESEAVIEAVGAMDEADLDESPQETPSEVEPEAGLAVDLTGDSEQADADESVTLRLASLGSEAGLDAEAELATPAQSVEPAGVAAEEMAVPPVAEPDEANDLFALRVALLAGDAELEAAEPEAALVVPDAGPDADDEESDFDAAEREAALLGSSADLEPSERDQTAMPEEDNLIALRLALLAGEGDLEAAEMQAAMDLPTVDIAPGVELAAEVEVAAEAEVAPQATLEIPTPTSPGHDRGREQSEEEAETAALREAYAIVLEGDAKDIEAEEASAATAATEPIETGEQTDTQSAQQHRRPGFLRRIIGG